MKINLLLSTGGLTSLLLSACVVSKTDADDTSTEDIGTNHTNTPAQDAGSGEPNPVDAADTNTGGFDTEGANTNDLDAHTAAPDSRHVDVGNSPNQTNDASTPPSNGSDADGTETQVENTNESEGLTTAEVGSESGETSTQENGETSAPGIVTNFGEEIVEQRVGNETVAWSDNLEGALGDWGVEGGVWAKGVPDLEAGPEALSGEQVFGTNLQGNTSINQDARLVSPEFVIAGDQNPRFRFAYWHSLGSQSTGVVEVSVDGGSWQELDAPMRGDSGGWGQRVVPLRDYDGKRVRVGVHLLTGNNTTNGYNNKPGIYVDDASFATGEMAFDSPDDLEGGLDNWSSEGGVWAKGVPDLEAGPEALSGEQVFGTNLQGNTSINQDSRLVSPELLIDGGQNPRFRFAYWHSLGSQSTGVVEISVDGDTWQELDAPMMGDSGGWGQRVVPLRDYDGKRVRIGVHLLTGSNTTNGYNNKPGIYVDDASFATD